MPRIMSGTLFLALHYHTELEVPLHLCPLTNFMGRAAQVVRSSYYRSTVLPPPAAPNLSTKLIKDTE